MRQETSRPQGTRGSVETRNAQVCGMAGSAILAATAIVLTKIVFGSVVADCRGSWGASMSMR
jgi:hypothetical protein